MKISSLGLVFGSMAILCSCKPQVVSRAPEAPDASASPVATATPAPVAMTLRALGGARGDGEADDRFAIADALKKANGQPVDGEGLTYAVYGTTLVRGVNVDLRNATIKQILPAFDTSKYILSASETAPPATVLPEGSFLGMVDGLPKMTAFATAWYDQDPVVPESEREELERMIHCRTFFVLGEKESPVSVKLDNVKILRGDSPENGMHTNSGGLVLQNCQPVALANVEVSGAGKGNGVAIFHCKNVRIKGMYVHDIIWAPYKGDMVYTKEVLQDKVGWNGAPIYDYDTNKKRFCRVRIQEQANGVVISESDDVHFTDSRIDRVGAMVEGVFYPWQADGMSIGSVTNLVIKDCKISNVWEGIDMTGQGNDGFVHENVETSDTFAYGFKYAHPQKNGKVINCTATRANFHAFTISDKSENIEFVNCVAKDTGMLPYWWRNGSSKHIGAFIVDGNGQDRFAKNIVFRDCVAINTNTPSTLGVGFSMPHQNAAPEYGMKAINTKVEGAVQAYNNFQPVAE
jgi:hypothetical protein